MSVFEYFLVPELILDFSLCLVSVFYIKKEKLEKMKGQIEFGPITKEVLIRITSNNKQRIVKNIVFFSIVALLSTSLISIFFTVMVEPTLLTFF